MTKDSPLTTSVREIRILIVDDEPDNRELLAVILTWEGFVAVTAANGEEALASIASMRPDLVLLDIMMPGLNGFEVAERIKADPASASVPIIMLSAQQDRAVSASAAMSGADDYLSKPLDREQLVARVRALLERSSAPSTKSV